MRPTYMWLGRLIAIAVVLQAAFIAWGTFDIIKMADDGEVYTDFNTGQAMHSVFGLGIIPILALILLIVSFFAKVPGGVRAALIVFGIVVLQIALAFITFISDPVVGLLHGINAFILAGVAGYASRLAAKASPGEAAPA